MWPLLSWSNPDRLGTKRDWKSTITEPLKTGQSHSASESQREYAVVCHLLVTTLDYISIADFRLCSGNKMLGRRLVDKLLPKFFKRRHAGFFILWSDIQTWRPNLLMLLRTKELIKNQLPQKFDEIVFCEFTHLTAVTGTQVFNHIFPMQVLSQDFNFKYTKTSLMQKTLNFLLGKTSYAIAAKARTLKNRGLSAAMPRMLREIRGCRNYLSI